MSGSTTPTHPGRVAGRKDTWTRPVVGALAIVVASTVVALFAAAIGFVLMAGRSKDAHDLVLGVSAVWALVAVLSLAVPTLVTGTDPTRIPLAALIAPPFGAVVTGFLAIAHARSGPASR